VQRWKRSLRHHSQPTQSQKRRRHGHYPKTFRYVRFIKHLRIFDEQSTMFLEYNRRMQKSIQQLFGVSKKYLERNRPRYTPGGYI
jgi:hypothetical protein